MTGKIFTGEIKARIIEVRFGLSGKVATVAKKAGDSVQKGNLLAALDRKILQTELDKQLADFEKTRADFEIFNLKQSGVLDDLTKYLKVEKQAQLNVSVKEVELAKARLDQADLFSPVEGTVIDESNITPGLYVTPSSNPFKILETASFWFEIKIEPEEIAEKFDIPVRFPEHTAEFWDNWSKEVNFSADELSKEDLGKLIEEYL